MNKNQPGTFGQRNGKRYKNGNYRINNHHKTKKAALSEAEKMRRKGYIATVRKTKDGYASYIGITGRK